MDYNQMDIAIQEAEATIRRAENYKSKMARFLIGRLRGINTSILKRLKAELSSFNSKTGQWK